MTDDEFEKQLVVFSFKINISKQRNKRKENSMNPLMVGGVIVVVIIVIAIGYNIFKSK